MIKQLSLLITLSMSSLSFATSDNSENSSLVVKPFKAEYTLLRKSDPVGKGSRELIKNQDGSYSFNYHTDIEWFIFSDTRNEKSQLSITDNKVTPLNYEFTREGTGKDKHYAWQYDIPAKQATNLKSKQVKSVPFPDNIQDKLSYHLQHRLNLINNPKQEQFVYPVIGTSGSIKNYVYEYDGEEELMLPFGLVKTIRLKREVVEKKRITYAWFAPELDYLMVKLYQIKGGVEQFEAQLSKVSYPE